MANLNIFRQQRVNLSHGKSDIKSEPTDSKIKNLSLDKTIPKIFC